MSGAGPGRRPPGTPRGAGSGREPVVVIGIGNEFRRDDGVGPLVVGELRALVPGGVRLAVSDGEPVRLLEEWEGAKLAVVIDAVLRSGAAGPAPGRTFRLELDRAAAGPAAGVSSHGLGLGDAISLARVLDMLPERLIVHAVEITDCGFGAGLSPAVAAAVPAVAAAVLGDLAPVPWIP